MKLSRAEIWEHNSFIGGTAMTIATMNRILTSKSASKETKKLAQKIWTDARKLDELLRTQRADRE